MIIRERVLLKIEESDMDSSGKCVIPEGIKVIFKDACICRETIKEIVFPESLEIIGDGAFYRCTSLTSITFPKKVRIVGSLAFANCDSLKTIHASVPFITYDDSFMGSPVQILMTGESTEKQKAYKPRFSPDDTNTIILGNVFDWQNCLDYASNHHFNVIFTDTSSCSAAEIMLMFQKRGYKIRFFEAEQKAPDGLLLKANIYAEFTL